LALVAIQPDDYTDPHSLRPDSSYGIWSELLTRAGHAVRIVDVHHADVLKQLEGCQAFMWRFAHAPEMRAIARRLLPVIEGYLHLVVYPDQRTAWHYDDKIAQAYLLHAVGLPTPETWVWHDMNGATAWLADAPLPLVLKLWSGAGSSNVRLLRTREDARRAIRHLFRCPVATMRDLDRGRALSILWAAGRQLLRPGRQPWELHKSYALLQEFLPGNGFDTRVTVIGPRAFAFRRFNRHNDFRASGSGLIDHNPDKIDLEFVRLGFRAARVLQTQSCAIDGLYKDGRPVIGEMSYTYASWAVHECPGHWVESGVKAAPDLNWVAGRMRPEEAQIEGMLRSLAGDGPSADGR
jgi:hypothetical protein